MFAGIALPELVVRDIAETAVTALLTDPTTLDYIMASRPQPERDAMRTALQHRPGKARIGYSLEGEEDWQVTVLMMGTSSGRFRTLGDVIALDEEPLAESALASSINANAEIPLPVVGGTPAGIPPRGRVRIGGELAIYRLESGAAVILESRGILGTAATGWPTDTLVSFHELVTVVGWGETCRLRVDVLSSNSYLNIILAATVKAALVLNAAAFNAGGLTLQDIDESDLTPRPAAWPSHLFNRTLQVTVARDFGLPETLPILTKIDTEIEVEEAPDEGPPGLD